MNADEVKSNVTKLACVGLGYVSGRYHLSGDTVIAIAGDVGAAAAVVYGWYAHWGMKKVPEDAKVTKVDSFGRPIAMLIAGLVLAGLALAPPARAQSLPIKIAAPVPARDLSNWSGWYVGAGLTGLNQGADILSGGLASLNASGSVFDVHAGALLVNRTYLLGGELGVGYQASLGNVVTPAGRWSGFADFRAGGSLAGLFGTFQAPANGGPFNLGTLFANAMPYAHFGPVFGTGNRTMSGVGLYVPLKGNMFLTGQYDYVTPGAGLQQSQGARLGINWAF